MKSIVEKAKAKLTGFSDLCHLLERDIILNGKAQKTYECYIHQIACISLHFNKLPGEISDDQIADYLFKIKKENSYSESYFKFTVFGLRYLFRLFEREDRTIKLPHIPHTKTLPVILSQEECKNLFSASSKFKDRFRLALIYSAGLRIGEAQRLECLDIDTDRMLIHVRQSKGKKDRYVVLSKLIASRFEKYCKQYGIKKYVFPGQKPGNYISKNTVGRVLKTALKKCGIDKSVCLHTLRHSYATHMLENGIDIVTVKEQLGHEDIQTTMLYLQVCNLDRKKCISPLDSLYGIK